MSSNFLPFFCSWINYTAVERRLVELVGAVAGRLHTGRSRNDQVATDTRLYVLDATRNTQLAIRNLQLAILEKSEQHLDVLMPGYTHVQRAQPILFSHWLMSYFWMLQRDAERLADCVKRAASLPLGAGALAGNALGIDREFLARELGFAGVSENSIDAVSDRDFIAEFLFDGALLGVHLSRLGEDLVLYSSAEFGFITMDDAYATGSSLMPQKKNPDAMELARGKAGRVIGNLVNLVAVLKGLPSSYDKDLQEDKEPLVSLAVRRRARRSMAGGGEGGGDQTGTSGSADPSWCRGGCRRTAALPAPRPGD